MNKHNFVQISYQPNMLEIIVRVNH